MIFRRFLPLAAVVALAGGAAVPAQTYEVIHDFQAPGPKDPYGPLVLGPDGNFYGTTAHGGHGCGELGCGTVYRLDSAGGVTTLHEFSGTDGAEPTAGLLFASSGDLYGVTSIGGSAVCFGLCGTVFRIDTNGTFATMHVFEGPDGRAPSGALIEPVPGELWGVTREGGDPPDDPCDPIFHQTDCGTIFRMQLNGALLTMHTFVEEDGQFPNGPLLLADDGDLYGTTEQGGANGAGRVFRISLNGNLTTVYDSVDGSFLPEVIQATSGDLIGTSASGDDGVYRVTLGGGYQMLHELEPDEGLEPVTPIQANDGFLYGITQFGGPEFGGTIYRMDLAGAFTTVHAFEEATGYLPFSGLTQSPDGRFYGTAVSGGLHGDGVIYRLTMPGLTRFYCPDAFVRRDQMAVFLLKTAHGSAFDPPDCTGHFVDVPCPSIFADWVEQLADEGITAGCSGGNYCPLSPVTRAQMAVFLLKTEHGPAHTPPPCTGLFLDVDCPSNPFAAWIEQLSVEGITGGCGGNNYCPDLPVTRAQMAAFLLKVEHGGSYLPPPCGPLFADVNCPSLFAPWIDQLYEEHITAGCAGPP